MTIDTLLERTQTQATGGAMNPLLVLRLGEAKHRNAGGGQPEVINLGPEFYDTFMKSYAFFKNTLPKESADQLDLEKPHLLGIPIRCNPAASSDIEFYVPASRVVLTIP